MPWVIGSSRSCYRPARFLGLMVVRQSLSCRSKFLRVAPRWGGDWWVGLTSWGRSRNGHARPGAVGRPRHRVHERRRARPGICRVVPDPCRPRGDHEFPGLADSTGARVLAEIGDDRTRFADARALKAYAGSAPVTRASGARSPSLTAISRTTDPPTSAGCGRSPPPPRTSQPAGTIGCGVRVATATPRPPATYSTSFSANSTTACSTSRPSTGCRPFRRCTTLRSNATAVPSG